MSGKAKKRLVRPVERQPMREWLLDKLNEKEIPGLEWVQKEQNIFRIKWCHGSRHGWSLKDTVLFERWAQHSGRHNDGDPKRWKANFRCALNSLKDVQEIKEMSVSKGQNAYKVYRMIDGRKKPAKPRAGRRVKLEPESQLVTVYSRVHEDDVKYSMLTDGFSDMEQMMSSADEDIMAASESEGYQTDVQDESSTSLSAEEHVSLSTPNEIKLEDTEPPLNINIPNFDKIIPGFYKIEFGKNHLLPRHGSGFRVDLLKQETPLTPTLQPFKIASQTNSRRTTARCQTRQKSYSKQQTPCSSFTHPSLGGCTSSSVLSQTNSLMYSLSQIKRNDITTTKICRTPGTSVSFAETDNCSNVAFPETPDGSEASPDSNSGEYIELTIYEEVVPETPVTSSEGCLVLTDLSKPTSVLSSHQFWPQHTEGQPRANPFAYSPLTPPEEK